VRASTVDEAAAERETIAFLQRYVGKGKSPMCGNSICQDRRFLAVTMPALEAFFHYRNLDVSTLKELARRWKPEILAGSRRRRRTPRSPTSGIDRRAGLLPRALPAGAERPRCGGAAKRVESQACRKTAARGVAVGGDSLIPSDRLGLACRISAQVGGDAVAPIRKTDRDFAPATRRLLERAARKRRRSRSTTEKNSMTFESLGLPEPVTRGLADAGYDAPTSVQAAAIPPAIAGADLMVAAATGSGKTASFMLPALHGILARARRPAKRREKGSDLRPARAGADADARARDPDRQGGQDLRPPRAGPARRHRRRRRALRRAAEGAARPARRPDRDPGGCSITCRPARPRSATSRCSSSTRPTGCSTWASSTTSAPSPITCRRRARP
jgi:hypothetical protein